MTYVRKNKERFEIATIVWEAAKGRVGAVDSALVASDLGGLQVTVLDLVERTGALIAEMPPERVLTGRAPIYQPIGVATAAPQDDDTLVIEEPVGQGAPIDVAVVEEPVRPRAEEPRPPVEESKPAAEEPKPETPRPPDPGYVDARVTAGPMTAHVDTPADDEPLVLEPLVLEPVEEHVSTPQDLSDPRINKKGSTEFYETWWFWTIVGGVAAGSAAAIALSQDGGSSSGPGGFRATVTW
jgi:hypothetical protein